MREVDAPFPWGFGGIPGQRTVSSDLLEQGGPLLVERLHGPVQRCGFGVHLTVRERPEHATNAFHGVALAPGDRADVDPRGKVVEQPWELFDHGSA